MAGAIYVTKSNPLADPDEAGNMPIPDLIVLTGMQSLPGIRISEDAHVDGGPLCFVVEHSVNRPGEVDLPFLRVMERLTAVPSSIRRYYCKESGLLRQEAWLATDGQLVQQTDYTVLDLQPETNLPPFKYKPPPGAVMLGC